MNNRDLKINAIKRLASAEIYFKDHFENLPVYLDESEREGKEAVLLMLCQSVLFIEQLSHIHAEFMNMLREEGATRAEEFLSAETSALIAESFNRHYKKKAA